MGKLVVEVGGSVSNNTNGEVKTGDGLGRNVVGSWREGASGGYSIGGAELATIEEEEETVWLLVRRKEERQGNSAIMTDRLSLPCARGKTFIKVTPARSLHDHGLYQGPSCNIKFDVLFQQSIWIPFWFR